MLDEELALLRGNSQTYGRPVYNRLFWNFTKDLGEVAYAQTYNLSDENKDGFINEKDAMLRRQEELVQQKQQEKQRQDEEARTVERGVVEHHHAEEKEHLETDELERDGGRLSQEDPSRVERGQPQCVAVACGQ